MEGLIDADRNGTTKNCGGALINNASYLKVSKASACLGDVNETIWFSCDALIYKSLHDAKHFFTATDWNLKGT